MNGNRCFVIDSSERYPLTLSVDVLRLCGVYVASNLLVGDLKEVLAQD